MGADKSRVLMLSHRNVAPPIPARCLWYEFEDIIREIDSVDMLAPGQRKRYDNQYRWAARIGQRLPIALNPGVVPLSVEGEYDIFFTVCAFAKDLLYVNALDGWRKRCKTAVCWVDEVLLQDMWYVRYFKKIISKFDIVVVSCKQIVPWLQACIGGNCLYRVPGIDAILFCPYPELPERCIDVLSIGRRSEEVHRGLLEQARQRRMLYIHDTFSDLGCKYGITVRDPSEHRLLVSNLITRSRFFTVNPGKFDDESTGNEDIIGSRYIEGAAAGSIMIGRRPRTPDFSDLFPWPNSVLDIYEKNICIVDVIAEVDKDTALQNQIRVDGITHVLRRHDWVYRWRDILETIEMAPMPALLEREELLKRHALSIRQGMVQK
jgi:hypothetical protein